MRHAATPMLVGILDLIAFVLGVIPADHFGQDPYSVLAASLAAISFISFCGFYYLRENMRDAIAAGFILTYFALATHLIITPGLRVLEQSSILGKVNTFIAVVIGFYFGTEALEKIFGSGVEVKVTRPAPASQAGRTEPRSTEIIAGPQLADEKSS
jgi:hypothetical protein